MLEKCTFGLDMLPNDIKPIEKRRKTSLLKLDHLPCSDGKIELNSQIQVATASGKELWRGMTIKVAHCSEFARFPYPSQTLGGLVQSVPKSPDSLVVLESTAQGEGDTFHREWLRAEEGESDFVPIFIPWWRLPDAQLPVPHNFRMNKEERALKKKFSLIDPQVSWFRYVLRTECQGDMDLFNQEYPDSPSVAFLTSGNPAFPMKPLHEMYERARKVEPMRGEIVDTESGPGFSRAHEGCLAIYRAPMSEHEYTIGADASAGVEGGDFSAAAVYDRETSEIVAVWHGKISPIEFGQKIMKIGLFYNTAWLAPEITGGHGFVVIDEIKRNFYPKVYVYQRVDKIRNTLTNFLGWETTFRTRGLLLDSMHWALTNHEIMIWHCGTIQELREMRYVDPRKAEGLEHDDLAMAAMIAYRCHLEMPQVATGMPPRIRIPTEAKKGPDLPPMPDHGPSREIWKETDDVLRAMVHTRRRMIDEYGQAPDHDELIEWNLGDQDWLPRKQAPD
jgi:hypothetical protein